jgi:Glycosyl transferases group 1
MTCVGRLAVQENLEAFLSLPLADTKVLIGDGPQRADFGARHADGVFPGYRCGAKLAQLLGAPEVLVFPSLTHTFGLAMIEALACAVAAFPVPGPEDVTEPGVTGVRRADPGSRSRGPCGSTGTCAPRAPGRSAARPRRRSSWGGWRPLRRRCAPEWPSAAVPL